MFAESFGMNGDMLVAMPRNYVVHQHSPVSSYCECRQSGLDRGGHHLHRIPSRISATHSS